MAQGQQDWTFGRGQNGSSLPKWQPEKYILKFFKLKSIQKGYTEFFLLTVNRELSPHTMSWRTKAIS